MRSCATNTIPPAGASSITKNFSSANANSRISKKRSAGNRKTSRVFCVEKSSIFARRNFCQKRKPFVPMKRIGCAMQITTSFGPARVVSWSREIDPAIWKNAFSQCAKDHRYYEITEQTLGAQFEHRYLVLENARSRKTAVQPLFFVDQNLAEGVPLPLRKIITWPRRFFPRWLKTRMLCAGCCAG